MVSLFPAKIIKKRIGCLGLLRAPHPILFLSVTNYFWQHYPDLGVPPLPIFLEGVSHTCIHTPVKEVDDIVPAITFGKPHAVTGTEVKL